jgi:hypothetical protein
MSFVVFNLHLTLWLIKSRNMRLNGPETCMEKREIFMKFWLGNRKGKSHRRDVGTDGRIILNES